jgi:hypothetical protein
VVRERFEAESLHLVKYLSNAQDLFAALQSVAPAAAEDESRWKLMLFGKWIDPLFALMAIFEAIRRGQAQASRESFAKAIWQSEKYFGELPDGPCRRAGSRYGSPPNGRFRQQRQCRSGRSSVPLDLGG